MGGQTRTGVYAGKTAEERDQERRGRLLETGLETFGTVGLSQSAIESLCSDARVATRHFYELFASKEELLLAVDTEIMTDVTTRVLKALRASDKPISDRVRAGLYAYASAFSEDRRKAQVHFFEVLAVTGDSAHRRTAGEALIETFALETQRFVDAGLIPQQRDLKITGVALLGATRYVMSDWALDPRRYELDAIVDELAHLYVASLRAD